MKSLTDYTQTEVTALFEKHGAFFAFSRQQFGEKAIEGVEYCSVLGGGDCVPKENAEQFVSELSDIYKKGREQLLQENSIEDIIRYELSNHECYYTGDWMEAFQVVEEYGATKEQVHKIYVQGLRKNRD